MGQITKKILAYEISWKNRERLDMFHQLSDWYPKAFLMFDPKPLAVTIRATLEARTDDILQGAAAQETLYKTVRTYLYSRAYLQAVMKGGDRINLEGEVSGQVTELQQAHARSLWNKLYEKKQQAEKARQRADRQRLLAKRRKAKLKKKRKTKISPGNKATPVTVVKKKRIPESRVATPRVKGIITHYVEDRAFGFLQLLNGTEAIFFHKQGFNPPLLDTSDLVGRIVTLQPAPGRQKTGGIMAVNLAFEEEVNGNQ